MTARGALLIALSAAAHTAAAAGVLLIAAPWSSSGPPVAIDLVEWLRAPEVDPPEAIRAGRPPRPATGAASRASATGEGRRQVNRPDRPVSAAPPPSADSPPADEPSVATIPRPEPAPVDQGSSSQPDHDRVGSRAGEGERHSAALAPAPSSGPAPGGTAGPAAALGEPGSEEATGDTTRTAGGSGDRRAGGAPSAAASGQGAVGEGGGGEPGGQGADYGPYLRVFRQRVQESLRYPLAARRQGLTGTVELEVVIEPTGRVRSVRVLSSSSHRMLDAAAVASIAGMEPVPLPPALAARPLQIRVPLLFELR